MLSSTLPSCLLGALARYVVSQVTPEPYTTVSYGNTYPDYISSSLGVSRSTAPVVSATMFGTASPFLANSSTALPSGLPVMSILHPSFPEYNIEVFASAGILLGSAACTTTVGLANVQGLHFPVSMLTVTFASTTYMWTLSYSAHRHELTIICDCSVAESTSAVCTMSALVSGAGVVPPISATMSAEDLFALPVTMTGFYAATWKESVDDCSPATTTSSVVLHTTTHGGMSKSTKAGIGTGVGVGALALVACGAILCYVRHRHLADRQTVKMEEVQAQAVEHDGPSTVHGALELECTIVAQEMANQPEPAELWAGNLVSELEQSHKDDSAGLREE